MLVKKLDFRCCYMAYKFFADLDEETRKWFDMNVLAPSSLLNYFRLVLSVIIPRRIILAAFPTLALIFVTYNLDHTIQAFGFLTMKSDSIGGYESELGLVVSKKLRRKGIGNMIVKALIDEAKRANVIKIFANVSKSNIPALNLFRKNGFSIDSKIRCASRYIMVLHINS